TLFYFSFADTTPHNISTLSLHDALPIFAFAGGGALNVKLNQKIIARPEVKELFVQPASGDAGTAVGAAAYVSVARGVPVEKMEQDRKSTRLNSSHVKNSYAVICLKKKKQ